MAITASAAGGNWNANASWVGSVQPGAGDDVVIDATSAGITIPTGTTVACLSLNMTAGKLTYATTSAILNINAGFTASAGSTLTLTGAGQMNFVSTSNNGGTGWSVTTGTKVLPTVTFNGAGGKWVLQDAFSVSTRTLTLSAGTLDTNGKSVTAGAISSSGSTTRNLTLGASTLTLSSASSPVNMSTNTGLTVSAASSTISCTGTGPTFSTTTSETWGTVTCASAGDFVLLRGLTCGTFTRTGTAVKTDSVTLGGTLTVSGVFTCNGNSITNRVLVRSDTIGTARTISAATVTASHVDLQYIAGAGASPWSLAAITGLSGNCGGNSGITFTTPVAQTYSGTVSGSWSTNAWFTRVPLPQDNVTVAFGTNTFTVTADMPRLGANITVTAGASGTHTFTCSIAVVSFGNVTLPSNPLTIGGTSWSLQGSGTITSGGKTFGGSAAMTLAGSYTLLDALTVTLNIIVSGSLDDGGFNVSVLNASANGGAITMAGAWSLTDATSGSIWAGTNGVVTGTAASSITIVNVATATTRTFAGAAQTYGSLIYTVAGSTGQLTITGNNTWNGSISVSDVTNARTVSLAATTQTFNEGADFNVQGTSGKLMTVTWTGTLSAAGGAMYTDFCVYTSLTASGGVTFFAGASSTNGGGTTGLTFSAPTAGVVSAAGGNWSAGAAWFSGSAPTSSVNVVTLPGTRSGAVTLDTTGNCRSFSLYGHNRTFAMGTQTLNVGDASGGTVRFSTFNTLTFTSAVLALRSTSGGYNFTSAGQSLPALTVNGSGGTWTPTDSLSIGTNTFTCSAGTWNGQSTTDVTCGSISATGGTLAFLSNVTASGNLTINGATVTTTGTFKTFSVGSGTITLTSGTWTFGGGAITCGNAVLSGSGVRTVVLSAGSVLTCSGTGTAFDAGSGLNLTVTSSNGNITLTGADATFTGGGKSYNLLTMSGSGVATVTAGTFSAFTRTGTAAKTDELSLGSAMTVSLGLTIAGNSATNRVLVRSSVLGTSRTITGSNLLVTISNCDFQDITGAGTFGWDVSAVTGGTGDCGGNSGITFTTPVTRFGVVAGNWSNTATWSSSTGGAGGSTVPLAHDSIVLDGSSAAGTYTIDMPRVGGITATGFTRTLTDSIAWRVFGNLTLAAGMTWSASNAITFAARSSKTLTSAGKTLAGALTLAAPSGTLTLQDALLCSSSLTVTNGTFVDNAQTVSVASFDSSDTSSTRTLTATGAWSLTSTAASTIWNVHASATVTATSATITLANATANARTFAGAQKSYSSLIYTVAGSTGMLTITGSNTFGTLSFSDVTNARTLTLTAATTTTIGTLFDVNGTSGKLMSLVSSSGGVAATVSKSSGTVTCQFLSIQDSTATGGATWQANGSTDVSGNTGWSFGGTAYTSTITNLLGLLDAESSALSRYLTDALNGLDAATPVGVFARSKTDLSGLLDAAAQAATSARSQTDLLGMLDAATRLVTGARSQTDLEGLLDSTTQQGTWLRTVLDSLGGLDAATPTFAFGRSQGDLIGLLDTATRVVAGARSQTDLEGLLDSVSQAQDWVRTSTNTLGGLDAATGLLEFLYSVTDLSGLSDAASRVYTAARSQTDVDGLLDSNTSVSSAVRTATEAIGLLDSQIKALEHLVTDVLGGVDSRTLALGHSVTDVLGALDSSTALLISSVLITDILGATDTAVILGTFLRSLTNSEGLQDTRAAVSTFTRALTNTLGAVDAMTFMRLIVVWLSLKITTTVQDRKLTTSVQDRPITTTVEDRPIATASHNVSTSGEEI